MRVPPGLEWLYRLSFTFSGNLSQHIYHPLPNPSSIRLINLHAAHRNSEISVDTEIAHLDSALQYEAVSYCWGDTQTTRPITVNGRAFPVTINLHSALLSLRYPDCNRKLWIDALCINQRDYIERNAQLHLMRDIYRRAWQVTAFIGLENDSLSVVTDLLRILRGLRERFGGITYLKPDAVHLAKLGLPPENHPAWSALRYFFRRPWFQRVWVIQEVVNAAQLAIICGSQHLSWDDVAYAAQCVADSSMFATTDAARICGHVAFLKRSQDIVHRPTGENGARLLAALLYGSRRCEATDLRDKIYGLYPLITEQSELPKADYTKEIGTVYRETAAYLIKAIGRLGILSCAGAARHPHMRGLGLPSWVPDWHAYDRAAPLGPFLDSGSQQEVAFSPGLDAMTLGGKVEDEVVAISDTIQPFQDSIRGCNIDEMQRNWPDATVTLEPTGEEVRIFDVFLNGVVVDNFDVFRIPKNSFSRGPPKWMQQGIFRALYGRRVFRSREGLLGLTCSYAMPGDSIAVSPAAPLPFIIRPATSGAYELIGECFLNSFIRSTYSLRCKESSLTLI